MPVFAADLNGNTTAISNGYEQSPTLSASSGMSREEHLKEMALTSTPADELHDLVCVGFGPASLAIAVALHDRVEAQQHKSKPVFKYPKVTFLEKQDQFRWHAGMLLPGTRMQISFIKDLATLRDPQSYFTFLNYLKQKNRLVQFSNLDTFLPLRIEFEDYLKWAAQHFSNVVAYHEQVVGIKPSRQNEGGKYDGFEVTSQNTATGQTSTRSSRNVVIAAGGRPSRPKVFPAEHDRIIHSSQYNTKISDILPNKEKTYQIAVIGSGQSAAEVFHDLQGRFPNASTKLIIRDTALRPSDDSPFVNEIFDPEAVDSFYSRSSEMRNKAITSNRSTNYSVVRLNLIEQLYEDLYHQYIKEPDKTKWQHRILTTREIVEVIDVPKNKRLNLVLKNTDVLTATTREIISVDAVILATGYARDAHLEMLKDCHEINGDAQGFWVTDRDYQVKLDRELVEDGVGIWLQGCNEATHGLSDSLLSILATRSGELVQSLFGDQRSGSTM